MCMDASERLARRLMAKVQMMPNGCWHWTGAISQDGYGRVGFRGDTGVSAHRAMWETFVGEMPAGMHLDHVCHNTDPTCDGGTGCMHRRCVHPGHLAVRTPRQNVLAGKSPARANSEKTACDAGHPFDLENTYWRPDGTRCCKACRREAGRRYDAKRRKVA